MADRYEISDIYRASWPLLYWKGDEHIKGIYFDDSFGYLIDRGYAVRIRHDEPAPSVFLVPDEDDLMGDEVYEHYPYTEMGKVNRNIHPLFKGEELAESGIDDLFDIEPDFSFKFDSHVFDRLIECMPNKRERNRSLLKIELNGTVAKATVEYRHNKRNLFEEIFEILPFMGCNGKGRCTIFINANTILHALALFKDIGNEKLLFYAAEHKFKICNYSTNLLAEAIISPPKNVPRDDSD